MSKRFWIVACMLLVGLSCGENGGDTTPPTVISTVPADGDEEVAREATVTAAFSEAMDPATITGATFMLEGPGGAVTGTVSYDAGTQTASFDFPDNDLTVVWQHRSWGHSPDADYPWAATFYGDKGTLKVSVHQYDFIPRGRGEKIHQDVTYELEQYPEDKTEKRLEKHVAPAVRRHMLNFLAAIATRDRPVADIEEGHISSASCILANLALKLGRTLTWDAASGQVVGDEEANRLLRRPYRQPWSHPEPESV